MAKNVAQRAECEGSALGDIDGLLIDHARFARLRSTCQRPPHQGHHLHLQRLRQVHHHTGEVEPCVASIGPEDQLRRRNKGSGREVQSVPRLLTQDILPKVPLDRAQSGSTRVGFGPVLSVQQ